MRRVVGWRAGALALLAWGAVHVQALAASDFTAEPASSPAALAYAEHVLATGDHQALPFAIVDKLASRILVYRADGTLAGSSTVLLGRTKGDAIVPGVGDRTQSKQLSLADRTTPAGRFLSEPGHNESGEAVVWVDYDAAFAIHRLRPGLASEKRAQRMTSGNLLDKRISAGCVVVPVAFYLDVVEPVLGQHKGIVYVMTEDGRGPM
ncbi:MAG: L,D-transpeptidase [Aquabacterium sp.]